MLVELSSVLEIINKRCIKCGAVCFLERELKRVAYGKIYNCLNCGEDIYFDNQDSKWMHVSGRKQCSNAEGRFTWNKIAIPKPEDLET